MARRKRRGLKRRPATRDFLKLFVVATEGAKTEPRYFKRFQDSNEYSLTLKTPKHGTQSSPKKILKRVREYIAKEKPEEPYEVWAVVDRDTWPVEQLDALYDWSKEQGNYGLAVSNPMFEYWLLLHFEDGKGHLNARKCTERLKKHLPNYEKSSVNTRKLEPGIPDAIRRAEEKDNPPCKKWPHNTGTTVYRLVKKLRDTGAS